jgi:hypothetical protein
MLYSLLIFSYQGHDPLNSSAPTFIAMKNTPSSPDPSENREYEIDHSDYCSPDQCNGCTGCGEQIDPITVKIEWQHKGTVPYTETEVEKTIQELSQTLIISKIELIYFNNYFIKDVSDGHSLFLIEGKPLPILVPNAQNMALIAALEAGVFEALR